MVKFLPVLRGGTAALAPAESKSAIPIAFANYYADLMTHNVHRRARDWPVERAVAEGFDRVIWVFKSVQAIASDSARMPYRLRQDDEVLDDHPMYRLLNGKANPLEPGAVFRKRLSAQVLLSKRGAFVEYTKSNGGTPLRLDLLPPDRTEIIPATDGTIDHYRLTRRDGSYRNLDPDKVRWFRDPHPLDPYSGVTPLESAGMSVELDHFSRLYNVSFMQNDGRPGGVLGVRKTDGTSGGISEASMNRIEERFGRGPTEAGKLSVIAGELSYADLAARPRDMQYGATAKNAKIEILSAMGTSESVLGYAADRTFDNADAELYNYFTRTIPNHNDILLTGFDEDSGDDLVGFFDTKGIEVLERIERAKRDEARTEVAAGLRSPYSYAVLANLTDEIEDMPETRALYIPTGKTPLPTSEADAVKLGLREDPNAPQAPAPGAPGAPAALPSGGDPNAPAGDQPAVTTGDAAASTATTPGQPPAPTADEGIDVAALSSAKHLRAIEGAKPRLTYRVERKAAVDDGGDWVTSDLSTDVADQVEAQIQAALAVLAERWTERAIARMSSPKQRKGTRHWAPEYDHDTRIGTKALDAARSVDEQTWQDEADQAGRPLVTAAAVAAAVALLADVGVPAPPGVTLAAYASRLVASTVDEVMGLVRHSAALQARDLIREVNTRDQAGEPLDDIITAVRSFASRMVSWARGLATQVATATTNGARDDAAGGAVTPDADVDPDTVRLIAEVQREWRSRRDTRVRPTHDRPDGADGQIRRLDEPFIVGDSLLRRPGDPLAPLRETAGCRCFVRYRVRRSGRWATKPNQADALAMG